MRSNNQKHINLNSIYWPRIIVDIDNLQAGDHIALQPFFHVACLLLDLSITLGFFVKGMTQKINWDIVQVDIIGVHTMFLDCMICAIL
jgi:hypothetical protein